MATTLEAYYPFDSGAGASVLEAQWRRMFGNKALQAGVMRGIDSEMRVIQRVAGANMSVDVLAGEARGRGHVGYQTTTVNLGITANATGNPRIDRVIVRFDFVNNRVEYDVLAGTAAVSPAAPALTNDSTKYEISLAQIAVASGASSIVTANITDERKWANAILWVRTWAIAGTLAVPSGATAYINPVPFDLEDGWSAVIAAVRGGIRGGTSATAKIQKSAGTLSGALADVTGLTGLSITTTEAKTSLVAGSTEVTIADQSMIVPVLTAVTSSPDNLNIEVQGWKWPTPLTA